MADRQQNRASVPAGGTYTRVLVCDFTQDAPIVIYGSDFVDEDGHTLSDIFKFNVKLRMENEHRLIRRPVKHVDETIEPSIFCRVDKKVTPERLRAEVKRLNAFFAEKKTIQERRAMYKFMVENFYEKMMMEVNYVMRNQTTREFDWTWYDARTLRSTTIAVPLTDEEQAYHSTVTSIVNKDSGPSAYRLPSQPTSVKLAKRPAASTPNTSTNAPFKPPASDKRRSSRGAAKEKLTTIPENLEPQPGCSSDQEPPRRSRQSSAQSVQSETPSEYISGIPNIPPTGLTEAAIDALAGKIAEKLYSITKQAAKDANSEDIQQIKANQDEMKRFMEAEFEVFKQKIETIERKTTTTSNKVSKSDDDASVKLTAIIESQMKIEQKLKYLGNTQAEKEAKAVNMVGSFLPIDEIDETSDLFFSCHLIQELILKYLQPSIHGLNLNNLPKALGNAILQKLFTQNCRAHLVIGESAAGLQNKMWCKRSLPNGVLRMLDSLVLPYMAKKLKNQTRENALGLNVNLIKGKMQNSLSGDRSAFLRKAARKTKTPEDTVKATYLEDKKFYENNRHLMLDDCPTFEDYKKTTIKLGEVKQIFAYKAAGTIEEKEEEDISKALDDLKIGKGRKVESKEQMCEFIASVANVKGINLRDIVFGDTQGIDNPIKFFRDTMNVPDDQAPRPIAQEEAEISSEETELETPIKKRKTRGKTNSARAVKEALASGSGLTLDRAQEDTTSTSNNSSMTDLRSTPGTSKKRKMLTQDLSDEDSLDDFDLGTSSQNKRKKQNLIPTKSAAKGKKDSKVAKKSSTKSKSAPNKDDSANVEQSNPSVVTNVTPSIQQQASGGESASEDEQIPPMHPPVEFEEESAAELPPQMVSGAVDESVQMAQDQESPEQEEQEDIEMDPNEGQGNRDQEEQQEEPIRGTSLSQKDLIRSSSRIKNKSDKVMDKTV